MNSINNNVKNQLQSYTKTELINASKEKCTLNQYNCNQSKKDMLISSDSLNNETFTYSPDTIKIKNNFLYNSTSSVAKNIENIPYSLAAKRAKLNINSDGMPIINSETDSKAYENECTKIRNTSKKLSYNNKYCYGQTVNSYGYNNATTSCATYALATALSIKNNKSITPDKIMTNSATDGQGTVWSNHGAYKVDCSESEALLAIDAQLSIGNPVLIHTDGYSSNGSQSEHWATVIGKKNGEYTIIDPWDGKEHKLDEMQIYKNGGSIIGYTIIIINTNYIIAMIN